MYYTTSFVDQSMSDYMYDIKAISVLVGWYATISRFEFKLEIKVYRIYILQLCSVT